LVCSRSVPMAHSGNLSATFKLESSYMSPSSRAAGGCSAPRILLPCVTPCRKSRSDKVSTWPRRRTAQGRKRCASFGMSATKERVARGSGVSSRSSANRIMVGRIVVDRILSSLQNVKLHASRAFPRTGPRGWGGMGRRAVVIEGSQHVSLDR
jgi:hypothetical protein